MPYWGLYLQHLQFSALDMGELSALLVATKILAPNLLGWLADHTGKNLTLIRWSSFWAWVCFAGFLLYFDYWHIVWITLGFSFFWNASLPQFEAVTLFHLKTDAQRYSRIRLWGSIGFIIAVIGLGYWIDDYGIRHLPLWILGFLGSIWLISLCIPDSQIEAHDSVADKVLDILKTPEVIAFLSVYLLLQLAHGPYYVFYSIYLKQYHYSSTLIGALWAGGVIAEVVLFMSMKRLLQAFSLRNILLCSLFLAVCRWLMIGFGITNLTVLALAQVLHAASFGATHVVAIHLVHRYFGNRHQGKGQAFYSSLSFGVGGMLGSLYSGWFWDSLGPQWVYWCAAASCGIALLIAYRWIGRDCMLPIPNSG